MLAPNSANDLNRRYGFQGGAIVCLFSDQHLGVRGEWSLVTMASNIKRMHALCLG